MGQSLDPARVDSLMAVEKHHQVQVSQPGFIHQSAVNVSALWGKIQSLSERAELFPSHLSLKKAKQLPAWKLFTAIPILISSENCQAPKPASSVLGTSLHCARRGMKRSTIMTDIS